MPPPECPIGGPPEQLSPRVPRAVQRLLPIRRRRPLRPLLRVPQRLDPLGREPLPPVHPRAPLGRPLPVLLARQVPVPERPRPALQRTHRVDPADPPPHVHLAATPLRLDLRQEHAVVIPLRRAV